MTLLNKNKSTELAQYPIETFYQHSSKESLFQMINILQKIILFFEN
jgi:hypothetical protein